MREKVMIRKWFVAVPVLLASVALFAQAAPPATIHYQGVLRNGAGSALSGTQDMVFRFFDTAAAGDEILVDRHTVAQGGAVSASGGLFAVQLGGGAVSDGSGPGLYMSLPSVFGNYGSVWMELEVGGEVLSPRTPISSAPYAQNAHHLDGYDAPSFARPAAAATITADWVNTANPWDDSEVANNLTLAGGSVSATPILLEQGVNPTQTAEGRIQWDSDDNRLVVGNGAGTTSFYSSSSSDSRFLRRDASDSFTTGTLSADPGTTVKIQGRLEVGSSSASDNDAIFFDDGVGSFLQWTNAEKRFDLSSDFRANGDIATTTNLFVNVDGPEGDSGLYFFNTASAVGEYLRWSEALDQFQLSDELLVNGPLQAGTSVRTLHNTFGTGSPEIASVNSGNDLYVSDELEVDGVVYLNGDLRMGDGVDKDQSIYFTNGGVPTAEYFRWTDLAFSFELSRSLIVGGSLTAASIQTDGPVNNKGTTIFMNSSGPDQDSKIFFYDSSSMANEFILWDDFDDRFYISDDVYVANTFTAAGTKSFVQNHPERPDRSVLYVALEGDEAGTYTRGSARLTGGEARVALGESFKWVTNPDIGLTAHLTPREKAVPLAVKSLSTTELVVVGSEDVAFDFVVYGLRVGYESKPVVVPRTMEAKVPSAAYWAGKAQGARGDPATSPLQRFQVMEAETRGESKQDYSRALTLRRAVGEFHDEESASPPDEVAPDTQDGVEASSDLTTILKQPATSRAPKAERKASAEPERADAASSVSGAVVAPVPSRASESFLASEVIDEGDLLALDPRGDGSVRPSRELSDPLVLGVALTSAPAGSQVSAAVTGVARVKADASFGPIRPGDLLAGSPVPGMAGKAFNDEPGTVLGKALEPLSVGQGLLRVLVMVR